MGHETEIKLRVKDVKALRARLKKLGARRIFGGTGRVHERNVLFDTASQVLKRRRELLRIRTETPEGSRSRKRAGMAWKGERVLLTFKRPVRYQNAAPSGGRWRHKVREEIELEVSDAATLTRIFAGLGMREWFRYEKFRTTFRLRKSQGWAAGLLLELDETPIGTFMELEGPAKAIDRAAKELGFSRKNYLISNYFSLYRMDCERRGQKVGNMVFAKATRQKRKWMTKVS